MYAARFNENPEIVRALLDAGASADARTPDGRTSALKSAVAGGSPEIIRLLLDAGASIDAGDESGATVLMDAAKRTDNPVVIQILLNAGADTTIEDNDGRTAWDHIQENESLVESRVYRELNNRRSE